MKEDSRTVKICYYISGHGFGHATRAAQLTASLLDLGGVHVTVCTLAPSFLFDQRSGLEYRRVSVDSSIVQPLPYDIDVSSTFKHLQQFVGTDERTLRDWVQRENEYLTTHGFNLILADAPWIIGLLKTSISRILVSNFTFDIIFQDLLQYLPKDSTLPDESQCERLNKLILQAYQGFTYLIRLPGYIDFPFLKQPGNATTILDAPLVFRPSKVSRDATLDLLKVPISLRQHKVLLVQFGGHLAAGSDTAPDIPEDWICLLATPVNHPRFFSFNASTYLPDLVSASDAVLGKIGYGTVSECVGMAKPLLYVARKMFAEEPYLLEYMASNGTCLELDKDDFERGNWSTPLQTLLARADAGQKRLPMQDGSAELAKNILDLID